MIGWGTVRTGFAVGRADEQQGLTVLPRRVRGLDLQWSFAILSFGCIAAVTLLFSLTVSRFLTAQLLDRDAEVNQEFVTSVIAADQGWGYFTGSESDRADRPVEQVLRRIAKLPDVARANAFASDGTILWSSAPELIGRLPGHNNPELEAALMGRLALETGIIGAGNKAEHEAFLAAQQGLSFVETYIPIWSPDSREVIGVVEIYRVPRSLFRAIDTANRLVWACAAGGSAFLYLVLFWIVRRGSRVIRAQQRQLIDAEGFAVLGEVASAVAHNIRNPLASIRSSAELVREDDLEGARIAAADITFEVDRLERWMRELLAFIRSEPEVGIKVDVNRLIRERLDALETRCQVQGVRLQVGLAEALPPVRACPLSLGHVLDAILVNAVEAMPRGGELRVESRRGADGQTLALEISDSGRGIPAGVASRLFRGLITTKRTGLGLGLPLAHRVVSRAGGAIRLKSVVGRGTRVVIRMPASG